jgi:hypothetical protein
VLAGLLLCNVYAGIVYFVMPMLCGRKKCKVASLMHIMIAVAQVAKLNNLSFLVFKQCIRQILLVSSLQLLIPCAVS